MNPRRPEMLSISAVRDCIAMSDYLSPYIEDNDKEPSWDGYIAVYDDVSQNNSTLRGRVPVQVKGISSNDFSKDSISFPVKIDDMRSYRNDGGAIYFVVLVSKSGERKIYYVGLTPMFLNTALLNTKTKKTKNIHLNPFPSHPDRVTEIVSTFLNDCFKQKSFAKSEVSPLAELEAKGILERIETSVVLCGDSKKNPLYSMLNRSVYLYARIKDMSIPQPLAEVYKFQSIRTKMKVNVMIGARLYYDCVELIEFIDKTIYRFGKSLTFTQKSDRTFEIHYEDSMSLSYRIRDLHFFIKLCENGEFQVNGKTVTIDSFDSSLYNFDVESAKLNLRYFEKVGELFNLMGVHDDVLLSSLSDKDWSNLSDMVQALIDKEPLHFLNDNLPPVVFVNVGRYKFMVALHKINETDKTYEMHDFFNYNAKVTAEDESGGKHEIPSCSILSVDHLLTVSNIKFEDFLPAFQQINTPFVRTQANLMLLRLLHAYDSSGATRPLILKTARSFAEWLIDNGTDVVPLEFAKLNLLQTYKRERDLSKDEVRELYEVVNKTAQQEISLVAAHLLLGNQMAAEIHFEKLSDKVKKEFEKYPIYSFWDQPADSTIEKKEK